MFRLIIISLFLSSSLFSMHNHKSSWRALIINTRDSAIAGAGSIAFGTLAAMQYQECQAKPTTLDCQDNAPRIAASVFFAAVCAIHCTQPLWKKFLTKKKNAIQKS